MRLIFFFFFVLACRSGGPELAPHCHESTNTRLRTGTVPKSSCTDIRPMVPPYWSSMALLQTIAHGTLTEERSIAVALQRAGMDAWLIDLRGHGEALRFADGQKQRHGWSLDDYGAQDLHTAIEHILQIRNQTSGTDWSLHGRHGGSGLQWSPRGCSHCWLGRGGIANTVLGSRFHDEHGQLGHENGFGLAKPGHADRCRVFGQIPDPSPCMVKAFCSIPRTWHQRCAQNAENRCEPCFS